MLLAWLGAPLAGNAQQYSLRYHGQSEGLGNLSVTSLAQDGNGYLWTGTENGLYRYDGTDFVRWGGLVATHAEGAPGESLLRNITALHVDFGGNVWVGTGSELYVVQGDSAVPVRLNGASIPVWPGANIASTTGRVFVISQRRLIELRRTQAGSWSTRLYFDAAQLAAHPQINAVSRVYSTRDGTLWLSCDQAVCRVRDGRIDVLDTPPVGPQGWRDFFEDSRGNLWLRSPTRILKWPRGGNSFVDLTPPDFSRGAELVQTPLVEDVVGDIVTSIGTGIVRWNGQRWERIDADNGLIAPGGIVALLTDRNGDLWLGTSGNGLGQWSGYRHLTAWTTRQGLADNDVWAFARDRDGTMHIGTATGIAQLSPGDLRIGSDLRDPSVAQVGSLARDVNGDLWAGTFSGALVRIRAKTRKPELVARLPLVLNLFADSAGRIWVCTQQGLFLVDVASGDLRPRRVDAQINPDPAIGPRTFTGCETASHRFWFLTDAGLLRRDGDRLSRITLRRDDGRTPYPEFEVVECNTGEDLLLAGGSSVGIWRAHWTGQNVVLTQIAPPQLANVLVVGLLQDRRGWLWVSMDTGVAVWNGTRWRFFDEDSGLVWNDSNQRALYEDTDGSIWIGTSRGAQHVEQVDSIFAPPLAGTTLVSLVRGDRPIEPAPHIELPWSRTPLKATFTHPTFQNKRAEHFHYRLIGLDDAWSVSAGPEVTFSTLPPGSYRLEVLTENAALQFRSPIAAIAIDITPPWWRTLPFYVACMLAAGALAWSLHAWRLRTHARQQRYLESVVAERTRELEASRERMRELALKDGLTDVWNRRALMDILKAEMARSVREGTSLTLVIVDADHFKRVNDNHGHLAGDAVLKEIAQRLQAVTRAYDMVGRYGGEEFMLVLPGLRIDGTDDRRRIEAFHRAVSQAPIPIDGHDSLRITCSFGVTTMTGDVQASCESLIARADAALYRAKEAGRDRIEYA